METMHYVGLDIHKKIIAFCIKTLSGTIVDQGTIPATKRSLTKWMKALDTPWTVAMEATLFTGWIYDFIKPHAFKLCVAHPEMLKAITAAKKKNDKADAEKIADLLRVNMIPECYMMPYELRELRKILRYRNHVVRTAVKEKNKISGLLMEVGAEYSKKCLHGKKYFCELLDNVEDIPESVITMLKLSRSSFEMFDSTQKRLIQTLKLEHRVYAFS